MKKLIFLVMLSSSQVQAGKIIGSDLLYKRNTVITKKSSSNKSQNLKKEFTPKKFDYNNFDESELRIKIKTDKAYQFSPIKSSKIKPPEVILLDYDNTLVDSWPQDYRTSYEALIALGLPPMSPREMLNQPHIPATQALALFAKKSIEEIESIYYPIYYKNHKEPANPVPGAIELLNYLKENGFYVSIVSNKEHSLLEYTIEQVGWKNYFNHIVGARVKMPFKPSPEVIEEGIKDIQIQDKKKIWFAGDAFSTDILCAVQGQVTPVWVSKYSVDQLNFSDNGIPIIHALDCYHLKEIIESSQKNFLSE